MKKKILLIRNAYSYDFGGAERFPVSLALELEKLDMLPIISSRSKELLKLASRNKLSNTRSLWWSRQNWSGKNTLLFPVYFVWQIILTLYYIFVIISRNVDIVHPQSRDDFVGATFAGKVLRKQVVWTDHADLKYVWQNHKVWYKNPVGKLVYLASKLADHITLVSESEKSLIEKSLSKNLDSKFTVIHNGVSDRKIEPIKRTHADENSVIFSATSRMVTAKGIGELIDAFMQLNKSHNTRLWLLGVGPEMKKFKLQAKHNKHIVFLDFPENALSYVSASDIFVHPSYHEGFSLSLLEAAMIGLPTIACNVGGNSEIIKSGHNGILVRQKSSNELYEAMKFMIENPKKRLLYANNIRRTYENNFNFSDIVSNEFMGLYEK